MTCPTCGQPTTRAGIITPGRATYTPSGLVLDGWGFDTAGARDARVGGWTPQELASIAADLGQLR